MKLRNKLAIISATAMMAFVGVGYAAWTFNNSVAQTKDLGNYVTSAIEAKNVEIADATFYLVLDQAKPYWSTAVDTGSKPVEVTNGKITVTPKYEVVDQNDGASWTYTLTSAIDASAVSTYVNVTGFDTVAKTGTVTADGGNNQIAAVEYALPALSYTASKPADLESYNAMVSALDGAVITFTFDCSFVEVA